MLIHKEWEARGDHMPWEKRWQLIMNLRECWRLGGLYPMSRRLDMVIWMVKFGEVGERATKHPWVDHRLRERNQRQASVVPATED